MNIYIFSTLIHKSSTLLFRPFSSALDSCTASRLHHIILYLSLSLHFFAYVCVHIWRPTRLSSKDSKEGDHALWYGSTDVSSWEPMQNGGQSACVLASDKPHGVDRIFIVPGKSDRSMCVCVLAKRHMTLSYWCTRVYSVWCLGNSQPTLHPLIKHRDRNPSRMFVKCCGRNVFTPPLSPCDTYKYI